MKKLVFLLLCFLRLIHVSHGQVDYDSCIVKLTRSQLLNEIARYSEDWKKDSLAKNGFRRFFGKEFLWCSGKELTGIQWSELKKHLGLPHFSYDSKKYNYIKKGEVHYRYVLFAYRSYKQFKDLGNMLLDIIVVNGVVARIGLQEVDG